MVIDNRVCAVCKAAYLCIIFAVYYDYLRRNMAESSVAAEYYACCYFRGINAIRYSNRSLYIAVELAYINFFVSACAGYFKPPYSLSADNIIFCLFIFLFTQIYHLQTSTHK